MGCKTKNKASYQSKPKRQKAESSESETYFMQTETVHLSEPTFSDELSQNEIENESEDIELIINDRNFVNTMAK